MVHAIVSYEWTPTYIGQNSRIEHIQLILKCGLCLEPLNQPLWYSPLVKSSSMPTHVSFSNFQCGHLFCHQCAHNYFTCTLETFRTQNPEFDKTTSLHISLEIKKELEDPATQRSLRQSLISPIKSTSQSLPHP